MRLGAAKQRRFSFHPGTESFELIHNIMQEQGAAWGMRREVEMRAEYAIHEVIARVSALDPFLGQIDITAEFDEFKLEAALEYVGTAPVLADSPPTAEDLATDAGVAALSGFMIRQYADLVRIRSSGPSTRIELHFEH